MTTQPETTQHKVSINPGDHIEMTMTAGEALVLTASTTEVQSMTMDKSGALLIQMADGASLMIKNFAEVATAASASFITLPSGQAVNLSQLIQTLAPAAQDDSIVADATPTQQVLDHIEPAAGKPEAPAHVVVIARPHAHENVVVKLHQGDDYKLGFNMADPSSVKEQHGQLVIAFKDGGEIIIPNYGAMKNAGLHDIAMKDGTFLSVSDLGDTLAQASQLNEVEPAAGSAGAGAHGGGFGFGSVFSADALHGLNPIGPIGETELQYSTFDRQPLAPESVHNASPPVLAVHDVSVREDGSVQLDAHAVLVAAGPHDHLVITISGIQPGWTVDTSHSGGAYDAAHGTWTVTLPNGTDFTIPPTVTPPAGNDADMTGLVVTATATDGASSATVHGAENVTIIPVADPVPIETSNASGNENTAIPLSVSLSVPADPDHSEHITKISISGVPAGATLNHGALQSDGTWLLTQGDLSGLTITPAHHFNGDIPLTVTVTDTETTASGHTASVDTSGKLNVHVVDTINNPTLEVHDVSVHETGSVQLNAHASLVDPGPLDHLVVTISGIQPGWTVDTSASGGAYDAAHGTWTITLPNGADFNGGPLVTPPSGNDADMTGLVVTATATDGTVSAAVNGTESVTIIPDADPVPITTQDASGNENSSIPLSISLSVPADPDHSEHISKIVIGGVPAGATLNHGALQSDGTWLLTQGDLTGLAITPAHHFNGDIPLTVTVTDTETTASGHTASVDTSGKLTVHVADVINSPTLEVHDVSVHETGCVQLNAHASLVDPGPNDHLVVTISGIQPGWAVDTSASGGAYDAVHGTWTITLPNGADFNGGPIVTPPAGNDADMTGLVVTATATDGTVSAAVNGTENVTIIPDADPVPITAQDASGNENSSIPLSISLSVPADPDHSEHISKIVIGGVPAGATLNHGALQSDGTWLLAHGDLSGLAITPPAQFIGNFPLTVTMTDTETTASGHTASVDTSANLTVNVAHQGPIIIAPAADTVYEHDLHATGSTSVTDGVTTQYFNGDTGAISATGAASFSATGALAGGHLTEGGVAVTVTESGNTYVGMAGGHEVFTLMVQADGHYTFTLDGPLDQANSGGTPVGPIDLSFGVTATDSNGFTASTSVHVDVVDDAPVAHDDVNTFDLSAGHTDGNVVTGLNGGPGAADSLSADTPNTVTSISFGSTTVAVPMTGAATIDGNFGELKISSDGSYTYTLFSGGTTVSTPHSFTGNGFPASLPEGVAITPAETADVGEVHSNMAITSNTQITGQVIHDGAGYTNSLGAFSITADGTLEAAQMLVSGITAAGPTFSANAGAGATELGFFLVANGFNTNSGYAGLDFAHGTLSFVYNYGQAGARAANISDQGSHVSLVLNDANGAHVINGPIYFTSDRGSANNLNADGIVHTLSGVGPDSNTMTISFEDLPHGGDRDYNDAIFNVRLTDTVTTPPPSDQFTYALTDGDGSRSRANLHLDGIPPTMHKPTLTTCDVWVKEDHSVALNISANLNSPHPGEQLTVTVSGIDAAWTVDTTASGGTYDATTHIWTVTLPAGVTSFSGGPTLTPPHDSDVDLTGLQVTATATDGAYSAVATASENVFVDAVVDTPVLNVSSPVNFLWIINQNNPSNLNISTHAADTDGSEQVTKVVVNLNGAFSNPVSGYDTLADSGITLNHGTQTSHGIWTIDVNAQDASAALHNLQLITPTTQDYYWALHNGTHAGTIAVQSYVSVVNPHGAENDFTDNSTVVTSYICYSFAVSPLVLDLKGDGFDLVSQAAGVKFDMTNDGVADHTSWVGASDGLLAIDANHNGVIDNQSELFGNSATARDGFANLAQYDTNHDGVLDAHDSAFSSLLVWQDTNQDGVSQSGELHSLSSLGITSISLATTTVNQTIGDSTVTSVSAVTYADGHTTQLGDAWFNVQDATDHTGATFIGTDANDVVTGTFKNDILAGGGGNNVLTGGAGADTFVLAANGNADIKDFHIAEGDKIDISNVIAAFDPLANTLHNFVNVVTSGANSILQVDATGSGHSFHTVATVEGVHIDAAALLAAGNLIA